MKLFAVTGTIQPKAPFDFEKTLDFIGGFAPIRDEQTLAPSALTKTTSIHEQAIVFQLISRGTVEAPSLAYTLYSAEDIGGTTRDAAVDRIRFFLSLDDDLSAFYECARRDPPFARVVARLYGLHHVKFLTPFENACWAVISQRVPLSVAHKIKSALVEKFGSHLDVNGRRHWAFPEPAQLAGASERELKALVPNERKVDYLRAVIDAFQKVDDGFLRHGPYEAVRAWLLGIKGIGDWSADFVLLRGLGRMQRFHITHKSIFEKRMSDAASKAYARGKPLSGSEILQIAERYHEWQGYWAYYLRTSV